MRKDRRRWAAGPGCDIFPGSFPWNDGIDGREGSHASEMKPEPLDTVEIDPKGSAHAAVIWLHGLGADGHDFVPIVPLLGLEERGVRFVFPHAPAIPVTLNLGMVMRAWYDINALDERARIDHPGLERSTEAVRALVNRERERGIGAGRIVLAGFSQGGSVALQVALTAPERLAGVAALSSYLIDAPPSGSGGGQGLRIFQAHGTYDAVVPYGWGVRTRDRLQELGCAVTWKDYPMDHAVCPEEIEDLAVWLGALLGDEE
jgi:phospholipase/carboxylesterase